MTTPIDTKALRELLAKATPGPWKADHNLVFFAQNAGGVSLHWCPNRDENAALIATARNALPALLDEIERKDAEIAEAKGQIEHLDRENERLREALGKVRSVVAADRQALLDTHGNGTEIPATDELGSLGLYEYDGALHVIDAALAPQGEQG